MEQPMVININGNSNSNHILGSKIRPPSSLGASIKITPANSPALKPAARPPHKPSHYSTLSLQTVIGTTTSNPNGFSFHEPTKSFALCAGSATILAEVDQDMNISQRFFRARPTAAPVNPVQSFYNTSTPPTTPDLRIRSLQPAGRSSGINGAPYAGSPNIEWGENSGSRTWTSRERIKAITCVSISPNGRFLAVGETGYSPRVLIFSTAKDSPLDIPVSIMTDHSFGIRSLAFSPTSQYLATLGDINDGFLFIWNVNLKNGAAKLHSTNKCTSFVRDICWMGISLITVGIRHIKVWRLTEPRPNSPSKQQRFVLDATVPSPSSSSPRALAGRNCLLGSLGDCTFTCVSSISDDEAIVCSDSGMICILDDTNAQQKLHFVKSVTFGICSIVVDHESGMVWFGGRGRRIHKSSIDELKSLISQSPIYPDHDERFLSSPKTKRPAIISMGIFATHMVTVDSTRAIRVCPLSKVGEDNVDTLPEISMPAHRDAVLGIGALTPPGPHEADFFTWSSGGTVNFWSLQGRCRATRKVDLEQLPGNDDDKNELKIVRTTADMTTFISGDKYGVIRLITGDPWECTNEARAHGGEVTDIAVQANSAGITIVATCGRDRMVQLFKIADNSLHLIQTMDEHVGAVGRILLLNNSEKLLSCSSDRTVIVRDRMTRETDGDTTIAFSLSRVLSLKASPVSMTLYPDGEDTLILSTIDRHIHRFDIPSGRQIHSFKASDPETNDTVVLSSLMANCEVPEQSPPLLVGVSTTDKSIRVYDFEKDTLLTREFGHTEGVSDIVLIETKSADTKERVKKTLISTGLDGIIMIWELSILQQQPVQEIQQAAPVRAEDTTPAKELTAVKPPLRRILSKSELAGFQRLDGPSPSPTPVRETSPPRIRKKTSRYTISPSISKIGYNTPILSTPPLPPPRRSSVMIPDKSRSSPSPPSPKSHSSKTLSAKISNSSLRRPSYDLRSRTKSNGNTINSPATPSPAPTSEFGSLNMSTEQVCRTLRAYRKKLSGSTDPLNAAPELERELDLTVRALGERSKRIQINGNSHSHLENHSKTCRSIGTSMPVKSLKLARRIPSTPNLNRNMNGGTIYRTHSLDPDGEG
ncbi:WD domain-containing protein [Histoplasma capsulatum G186AR]|uniref:WD domain-containing protein n=1 Tax=Ajellomyces capsulatus TaxID=5037 RepID=A0A8H8D6B4_AJECA|nr:WD domain-containing protein [Histoplasma capsulatum]QSS71986.1 WD domain-containing protein [Histoplasma capsulatum G186AR]